jgi:hypothetical protein
VNATVMPIIIPGVGAPTAHEGLVELRAQIIEALVAVEDHACKFTIAAIRVGALLAEVKAKLPHGGFEPWIYQNLVIKPRTAQAYMRFGKAFEALPAEERKRVALLPLREAIKAVQMPGDAPVRTAATSPIRNRMESERVLGVFTAATKALRSARDLAQPGYPINSKVRDRMSQMRCRLQAAIDEIDRLGQQEAA